MAEGILLILSGPSGVGKGTVCRHLMATRQELNLSVSTTTRPPRSGEEEGREYNFTTVDRFKEMIASGDFLEWAVVHSHHYGTLKSTVRRHLSKGEDLILEIDVQGAAQVRKNSPGSVLIFLAPPSLDALEARIRGRGTADDLRIKQRLVAAHEEMEAYHLYDYVVVNDRVEEAAGLIGAIIDAEKCKVNRGVRPPGWGGVKL
jgi:guanylate kinase